MRTETLFERSTLPFIKILPTNFTQTSRAVYGKMVVKASVECKFWCRNKAVKRHSGLYLFQVSCGSSSCCSSVRTASPLRERCTYPRIMIRREGITLSCQPIKLISKDTALKRPREIKLWLGISPVSLHVGNLHKHLIQPTKIRTNFFFNWGRRSRGPALNTTMCNLITCRWESQLYHLSRGNLAVASVIFNILTSPLSHR